MPFLSNGSLEKRLPKIIDLFDKNCINSGAYELHLGPEVYVTSDKIKKVLKENEQIDILPGQFAVLLTEEAITMPNDLIAFISMKFGIKFRGLINVSGFHVDPGFSGRLKFSVYNAGSHPVVLSRGKAVFQIWFSTFDVGLSESYDGGHQSQKSISDEDVMRLTGEIASPAALKREIEGIHTKIDKMKATITTIISIGTAIFILLLSVVFLDQGTSISDRSSDVRNSEQSSAISADSQKSVSTKDPMKSKRDSSFTSQQTPVISKNDEKKRQQKTTTKK